MQSLQINNHIFSEMPGTAGFASTVQAEMEKRGISLNPSLLLDKPLFDIGLRPQTREPLRERDLSTEEMLNLFEKKEALKIAYIPHYLTQCVVYYLDQLVEYAKVNRLSDYKKHSRILKAVKAEYMEALEYEMPPHVFQRFLRQRDEYLASCGANLTLMYFTFGNEMLRLYGRIKHESVFCYANIIVAFIDYVEDFDNMVNKRIAEKMGMPCRNHGDARLSAIKEVCMSIRNQYPIEPNNQTKLCVRVMANIATTMTMEMQ